MKNLRNKTQKLVAVLACAPFLGVWAGAVSAKDKNLPGFSPLSETNPQSILRRLRSHEEFLNGCGPKPGSKRCDAGVQALTPTLSQRERDSNCNTTYFLVLKPWRKRSV